MGPATTASTFDTLPFGFTATVAMLGTNNTLLIQGTSGNATYTVAATQVALQTPLGLLNIPYSGINYLILNNPSSAAFAADPFGLGRGYHGLANNANGNDTYIVNGTGAANGTLINSGLGNNTLTVNASVNGMNQTVQETPVEYVGGTANTAITVNGTGTGDTIVAYDDHIKAQGAHIVGAGLQLQYTTIPQIDSASQNPLALASQVSIGETAGSNAIYVLGSEAPMTIEGGPGNDTLAIGGNGTANLPAVAGLPSPINFNFESLAYFYQPVNVAGSGADTLTIDDSLNSAEAAVLTPTAFQAVSTVTYSGIAAMNLFLGGGTPTAFGSFAVQGTISGNGGLNINTMGNYLNMTIAQSETPISINTSNASPGRADRPHPRRQRRRPAAENVQLTSNATTATVAGLGPVGSVSFSNWESVAIEEGSGCDTTTLSEIVPNTIFTIDGNAGMTISPGRQYRHRARRFSMAGRATTPPMCKSWEIRCRGIMRTCTICRSMSRISLSTTRTTCRGTSTG